MRISVIISTYNSPDWLEKTLWSYSCQDHTDFELVIADDGSGEETRNRIDQMREETGMDIIHVWHEDDGFRKCTILNKAIQRTSSDYLFFTDGDCIPRRDLLSTHARLAKRGCFLSGGYYKLPMPVSLAITKDDILSGRAFLPWWLFSQGVKNSPKLVKFALPHPIARAADHLTTTRATFNGCNTSAWKDDIVRVNGFDERMNYGGLDREVGERLVNLGIKPLQVRESALCLHLDHSRKYSAQELIDKNKEIRRRTREEGITWTPYGIVKSEKP